MRLPGGAYLKTVASAWYSRKMAEHLEEILNKNNG
jgi:hypothetical protein